MLYTISLGQLFTFYVITKRIIITIIYFDTPLVSLAIVQEDLTGSSSSNNSKVFIVLFVLVVVASTIIITVILVYIIRKKKKSGKKSLM